jgi:hypothetical protein
MRAVTRTESLIGGWATASGQDNVREPHARDGEWRAYGRGTGEEGIRGAAGGSLRGWAGGDGMQRDGYGRRTDEARELWHGVGVEG